ncbi:MAG: hypothetical protein K9G24_06520 [Candidatus Nanopelagicales bacterium]|nr:hypothetical protein [Candidatus Nanopelagicales bacterium]MCF8537108.1 hypothetical protein [Candidatus Nanopelagicales bacterium]MCF8542721.1 hypothetical protein [Candidatus Nanopelagicales bacterium]MCF8558061.1 hypothetical protein [Candidatus Nanopelagicales bacterium]MDA2987298.1 hypothetical protein [Actinomycetota bacterium]
MKITTAVIAASIGIAVAGLAAPAQAADGYNASIAGQRNYGLLANLSQSSTQTVDIVNLPAGVGLYALNCLVPQDPRSAPTVCDLSKDAAAYLPASGEARATASLPIKVNAEFFGSNPNPVDGDAGGQSVDCRADTGNPRSTTCAVYVLGAGRESANPAYLRVFPTSFLPVKAKRANDRATITLDGSAVTKGAKPKLALDAPESMKVTLASGLAPSISATGCEIKDDTITALSSKGTCIVRITSTGGRNYKPLVTTQVFRLTK